VQFQALTDRALDAWLPGSKALKRRDVFFLGNIDPNDSLTFDLIGLSNNDNFLHSQIRREAGNVIAVVFLSFDGQAGTSWHM